MIGYRHSLVIRDLVFSLMLTLYLVFLLGCHAAYCQIDSTRAKIELKSAVDRSEVPYNRELTFTVEASWQGEQDRFSITPILPPECEKLEILGSSSMNQTRMEEGKPKSIKLFKFNLKPTETGTGRIGSVRFSYVDNVTQDSSSLSTQPIDVEVTAPVKEKRSNYKLVLLVVVAAILAYVIYSAKRRGSRIEIGEDPGAEKRAEQEESLEQRTSRRLENIIEQLPEGRWESFPSEIYKLLTGYLDEKYQLVTSGKTTDDIIDSLAHLDIMPERITLLKEILSECDLAKFAAERMESSRCREMTNKVREFLEQKG